MMETTIQKNIIDYFSFFREFYNTINTCLKDCQKCAISINKFIIRQTHIKQAEVNETPLAAFEELQEKLCKSLHNLIFEEQQIIANNLFNLKELRENLYRKHITLLRSCEDVNFEEESYLVKGSPLQPPLKQLIDFANDTLEFSCEVCAQIESSLIEICNKDINTEPLVNNFRIPENWVQYIPEIIGYINIIL